MTNKTTTHSVLRPSELQAGVGMVEVLVALIVMSIGMLGIASLYVTALQAKTTSLSRMQAVNLATDMVERIRANRTAAGAYSLANGTAAATPSVNCVQTATTAAVTCSAAQMATADLFLWSNLVSSTLPGTVTRSIAYTNATPATYTITLTWSEPTSGQLSYVLQAQI